MRVGVYDSGVGGLSVVKSLLAHNLFDEIIYYGDTARVPYGVKDKTTIVRYSLESLEFLKNFDIKLLIVACNTVSAWALSEMQQNADFDIIGVIEPGVMATKKVTCKDDSVLILGTKATISSGLYQNKLKECGYKNIQAIAPSLFVPIVEEGLFSGEVLKSTMHHYFKDIKQNPDAVILGCTHFPLIQDALQNYFPKSKLIHSGDAIVEYLQNNYKLPLPKEKTKLTLLASADIESLKKTAKVWLNL
ncbi:MAG: glutamate racemase [Campylobacteraceae bacterium]